jgi:DNA repair protein SbcD/Mre11
VRLLHTSDWHLGQTLHNYDRVYEHQCFLDWLVDTLESEKTDALLIAGDIFDNANPSAESQKQFYRFLNAAKRRIPHLNIVIIAGNHDSAGRLEAPTPLLDAFDVTVVGATHPSLSSAIDLGRLIAPLRTRDGEIAAHCLAIPFLRPGDVPRVETDGDPYQEGVRLLYRRVLDLALSRRENDQAIIALGHCHMHGGLISEESERRIVIGGSEALSVDIFDPAMAYVALGHLHRAQKVGHREGVRYCGSPLPMSFTEIAYPHQVVRVDLTGDALTDITPIRIPRSVRLLRVPEQPAPMDDVLEMLATLDLPDKPLEAQPYLQVRVQLAGPEPGLRSRIDTALADKKVRLVRIETCYKNRAKTESDHPRSLDEFNRLKPEEIFRKLHQSSKYGGEPSAALIAAFNELLLESGTELAP